MRDNATLQARLSVAEDALRAIADPSCGHVIASDGLPLWDADAGYMIARRALARLNAMEPASDEEGKP
jgi:hypothetical protein